MFIPTEILAVVVTSLVGGLIALLVWIVKRSHGHSIVIKTLANTVDALNKKLDKLPCSVHVNKFSEYDKAINLHEGHIKALDDNCQKYQRDMEEIDKAMTKLKMDFRDMTHTVNDMKNSIDELSEGLQGVYKLVTEAFKELAIKAEPPKKRRTKKNNDQAVKTNDERS